MSGSHFHDILTFSLWSLDRCYCYNNICPIHKLLLDSMFRFVAVHRSHLARVLYALLNLNNFPLSYQTDRRHVDQKRINFVRVTLTAHSLQTLCPLRGVRVWEEIFGVWYSSWTTIICNSWPNHSILSRACYFLIFYLGEDAIDRQTLNVFAVFARHASSDSYTSMFSMVPIYSGSSGVASI